MAAIDGPHIVAVKDKAYECDDVRKTKERNIEGELTGWYRFDLTVSGTEMRYRARAYIHDHENRSIRLMEAVKLD